MYINLEVLKNSGLEYSDILFLFAAKQIETEFLIENLTDSIYNRLQALSLITHIKQKKKSEHLYTSLRLSEKGKQLITELGEAPVEEQDKTVGEWLCKYYLDAGKRVGNKTKTLRHIRDFRLKSGIEKNNLIKLCVDFLKENEDRSNLLEYVFYYSKNAYETKLQLDQSWLYRHYEQNRERLNASFEQY